MRDNILFKPKTIYNSFREAGNNADNHNKAAEIKISEQEEEESDKFKNLTNEELNKIGQKLKDKNDSMNSHHRNVYATIRKYNSNEESINKDKINKNSNYEKNPNDDDIQNVVSGVFPYINELHRIILRNENKFPTNISQALLRTVDKIQQSPDRKKRPVFYTKLHEKQAGKSPSFPQTAHL